MAEKSTHTVTPYAVHLPDEYTETEKRDGASWELGAGQYELGFEVDGAKIPLARVKAGGVLKKLAAAKAAKEDTSADTAKK
jgi:hypothetical protein